MRPPCKDCPDRQHPTCYNTCEKYLEFHAWCEEKRKARMQQNELNEILHNNQRQILRDKQRRTR